MNHMHELGQESYKTNPNLTHETLDTMDSEFRRGYKDARNATANKGHSVATVQLIPIAPIEDVPYEVKWSELTWLVSCQKYGNLATHEKLEPMRSAVCHILLNMNRSGKITNYVQLCRTMDGIYEKLMLLSDLHSND